MHSVIMDDFQKITRFVPDKNLLRNTRWLMTGVTGMIGSYLLSFLSWLNERDLDRSIKITAVHRRDISSNDFAIAHLLGKDFIEFRKMDLAGDFSLADFGDHEFVLHCASNAAPKSYLADPIGTINTNVRATQRLLEHVRNSTRLLTFLMVSSGEIYGDPDPANVPTPEEYRGVMDHLSPRSCYVESKRFAEALCWNYFKHYGIPIKVIRPVHVYGPGFRENDGRVWADFIANAVRGENIRILSDGKARRGFCYLADALTQILAVLQKGEAGGVFNVGNDQHVSIKELAEMVAEVSNHKVSVEIENQLPGYLRGSPQISCPAIAKVRSLAPIQSTSLRDGIQKSFDWFSDYLATSQHQG